METWWKNLDRILRGEATRMSELRRGRIEVPAGGLVAAIIILAMAYGACMGCFALFKAQGPSYWQVIASVVKVPALFLMTLAVTLISVVRLLTACLAIITAVIASLGPIVAFFSLSTTSYPFMILLNVVVFGVSGGMGLMFLLQTLHRLSLTRPLPAPTEAEELVGGEKDDEAHAGALDALEDQVVSRHVKTVFRCWMVLFGLVGAQMGWVLRPFIGDPARPFAWFRARESSFFEAVWQAFRSLFL
jgi:hypothetical protein